MLFKPCTLERGEICQNHVRGVKTMWDFFETKARNPGCTYSWDSRFTMQNLVKWKGKETQCLYLFQVLRELCSSLLLTCTHLMDKVLAKVFMALGQVGLKLKGGAQGWYKHWLGTFKSPLYPTFHCSILHFIAVSQIASKKALDGYLLRIQTPLVPSLLTRKMIDTLAHYNPNLLRASSQLYSRVLSCRGFLLK